MKNKIKISINSEVSLIEIIISSLIFAAAGIIMLNMFGIARYTQISANDKVRAGALIQSDIEIIKSLNSPDEMYEFLNDSYTIETDSYVKYFDENWVSSKNREFKITAIITSDENYKSGELKNITVSVEKTKKYPFLKGGTQVYYVETKKFFPAGGFHGQ